MASKDTANIVILIVLIVIGVYVYNNNIKGTNIFPGFFQSGTTSPRDISLKIDNRVSDFFSGKEGQPLLSVIGQPQISGKRVGVLIEPKEGESIEDITNQLSGEYDKFKYSDISAGDINIVDLDILIKDDRVKSVIFDEEFTTQLDVSVPLINADNVWNITISGTNIRGDGAVCIIDTGVDYNHSDIKNNYLGGYDIYNNDADPMDDRGHGTHVAGIVLGVAPDAGIVAVKSLNSQGSGTASTINKGIEWCIDNKNVYNIKIISMSLGSASLYSENCNNFYPLYNASLSAAIAKGIIPVAATGNNGVPYSISSPACMSQVIAVGASDNNDNIASFSNRDNMMTDVFAPGVSICAAQWDSYKEGTNECTPERPNKIKISGTSMATPHVSGAINLLLQYLELNSFPTDIESVRKIIRGSDIWIKDSYRGYSYPRINILRSIFVANGTITTTTTTSVSTTSTTSTSTTSVFPTHSQGPFKGKIFSDDIIIRPNSNASWLNPENVEFSDDIRSQALITSNSETHSLKVKDFGFNIPSDAIITGIIAYAEGYAVKTDEFAGVGGIFGQGFLAYKNNIPVNDFAHVVNFLPLYKPSEIPIDVISINGGDTSLWGTTWTPAEINSPNFGVGLLFDNQVILKCANPEECTDYNIYIDNIQVKVYYSSSAPSTTSSTSTSTSTVIPGITPEFKPGTLFGNNPASGTLIWNNPGNLATDDNNLAIVAVNNGQTTQWLTAKGFNFNIPSDATITGIQVNAKGYMKTLSGSSGNRYQRWRIIKNGIISTAAANEASGGFFGDVINYISVGGSTSLWQKTWTPSEINSPDFGIAFQGQSSSGDYSLEYGIDYVEVAVFYTQPTSTSVITTSVSTSVPTSTSTIPTTSILTTTSTIPTTSVLTTSTTPTTSIAPSTSVITTTTLSTIPTTSILTTTSTSVITTVITTSVSTSVPTSTSTTPTTSIAPTTSTLTTSTIPISAGNATSQQGNLAISFGGLLPTTSIQTTVIPSAGGAGTTTVITTVGEQPEKDNRLLIIAVIIFIAWIIFRKK